MISTHAPLAGRDVLVVSIGIKVFKFQPTRPLRGATESVPALATSDFLISTHAPLAGRDCNSSRSCLTSSISTHAPLAGRDDFPTMVSQSKFAFQPTRPLRGATNNRQMIFTLHLISTHAPLAGRDIHTVVTFNHGNISTHAPLAGRDEKRRRVIDGTRTNFNPRAPCGARRRLTPYRSCIAMISTHAPLAGRD